MKSNDENKIKKMYERIDTPEYDVKDKVMAQIRVTKKVPRINRKILLAAVLCLVFLLAGTAAAAGVFNHIFTLHLFSDELIDDAPQPTPTPTIDTSDMIVTQETDIGSVLLQFVNQAEFGEYRLAHCYDKNGMGHSSDGVSPVETTDFKEMKEYIENSNIPLPIPKYIPKGYEFSRGYIEFYFDERIFDIEPSSIYEEDGIDYYIYNLPDDFYKNILNYSMYFIDKNNNDIFVQVQLSNTDSGMQEVGVTDDSVAEYLDVDGFDDAMLLYDAENTNEYGVGLYKAIDPVNIVMFGWKITDGMQDDIKEDNEYVRVQDAVFTSISVRGLPKRKLTKIIDKLN
jgi:hypothetical protein